ncbi:MAG: hypothetical protein OEY59_01730 [Deltaproteobacteria bacterium]|nr:hypothetical protein [Deltaproteobacteria bacterium]
MTHLKKTGAVWFLIFVILLTMNQQGFSQDVRNLPMGGFDTPAKPIPMRNVFLNVVWGSLAGGMSYMGLSLLDDSKPQEEKYSFSNMTTQFIYGATYGGLLGLAAGVYFTISNITFRPSSIGMIQNSAPRSDIASQRRLAFISRSLSKDSLPVFQLQARF